MLARRPVATLLLLPLLLGAAQQGKGCACGRKPPPDTSETDVVEVPKPDDPLKVVSVEPAAARPATEQAASLYGSGFQDGLSVQVGSVAAAATFKDANTARLRIPGLPEGVYDVVVTNPDGKASTLRRGYSVKVGVEDCRFVRVSFEFDKSDPTPSALQTLESMKSCYLAASEIVIDGHADERGTTEYNLALAERRAEAIQRWMVSAGVLQARLRTVSYGEEKPLNTGHDDKAWSENRRAEIHATE
jgi:outer membrane protein OmpA-like peptidoglycan-associated protein